MGISTAKSLEKGEDMESLSAYIPMDRRQAMARGEDLPNRTSGAALCVDISGFIPLTNALLKELGPKHGADELTRQLNTIYGTLIAEVHRYQGSVIGFSGDAITCWFDDNPVTCSGGAGQASPRATACALTMQELMSQFSQVETPSGFTMPLAVKAAVATGPVRRFRVGDPKIQYIDVLAGVTLDRMATAEKLAERGEVLVGPEVIVQLGDKAEIEQWRYEAETHQRFAVVSSLTEQIEAIPWPPFSPSAKTRAAEELTEAQVRPWLLPPIYERLKRGQSRFLAEIRPAVALFLRFGGLDYDQDDAAGEKLDAYIRLVQNVLACYEGYLIQLTIGDKGSYFYATFGGPLAHDDDPARAVAAALELRSPPVELDFASQVQIGISQGRMRVGAYGSSTRRTYGVLGHEVNIAARLMQQAEPGQIAVSQRIAGAVAENYHLEYTGPVRVKGKREPIPVSMVLNRRWPSPLSPLTTRFTHPLVGREGEGQILRLEGVAGIGKSHLAAEFIKLALDRDLRVAVGACQSTTQDIPYYPWRQIFRALFDLTGGLSPGEERNTLTARQIAQVETMVNQSNPDWCLRLPLLGDLLGLPILDNNTTATFDPKLRQEALFALAVDMIQTWARTQPLLLLIEDAHWLDEASLGLTLALGRIIANGPILLALVQRPPDKPLLPVLSGLPEYNHLYLHELPRQGITSLITNRLGGQLSTLASTLMHVQAQGNPFFAEELVDTLRQSDRLQQEDDGTWTLSDTLFNTLREANCLAKNGLRGQWALTPDAPLSSIDLNIPDSIQGLVLSHLDHLTEGAKMTLKVASVIGYTFEFDLLAHAHPTQPNQAVLLDQIRGLEAHDLIRLETPPARLTYTFKHHLIQETAYETLPENQQRDLHRAVGETLEGMQPEAVERLAYHYRHSGVRGKTLVYLDQAARKSQREYANETALHYYNQALALEERWTWRQEQAEVLHILGRREEEEASLQALAANPEAPAFEAAYLWGQYYEAIGNYAQAQTAVERALSTSRELDNLEGEIRCLAQLGLIAYRQGDYERAKEWYNQALTLFDDKESHSDKVTQAFAQVFNGLGIIHHQRGSFYQAKTCYEQALTLSHTSGDRQREATILNGLGATAFRQRHFAEAMTYQQQALAIQRNIGDRAGEGTSLYNLAQITCDGGDYAQTQEYLSAALTILQATGNRWQEINVWNDLGILYQELGDLSRARTCLEQGLQLAKEIGAEEEKASYLLSNLGLVMRDQGNLTQAERLLTEGLAMMQAIDNKHQSVYFLSYLSTVSLQAGHLEQAIEQAQDALVLWHTLGLRLRMTDDLATLAAAHLAADNVAEALTYAEQFLALLEECGGEGPEFPQRDYYIGYRVLTSAGSEERADVALRSAHNLVITRAGKITDPDLRQSFLEQVSVNREIVTEYRKRKVGNKVL
jgi:adenylate cyclase